MGAFFETVIMIDINSDPRTMYTANEVGEVLGLTGSTIRKMMNDGRFPKPRIRVGRTWKWSKETIKRFIDASQPTKKEVVAAANISAKWSW